MRTESIRTCCGTPTDRTAPSPHARDCVYSLPHPTPSGGPYCIARACPQRQLHHAGTGGCVHDIG
jgi:hypothetical protein